MGGGAESFLSRLPRYLARQAFDELRTQSITAFIEPCPLRRWPAVPTTIIVMKDDRVVAPYWSRRMARVLPDTDLVELDGGHSPFYANPEMLGATLERISRNTHRHSHRGDGR